MQAEKTLRHPQGRPTSLDLLRTEHLIGREEAIIDRKEPLPCRPQSLIEEIQAAMLVVKDVARQVSGKLPKQTCRNLTRANARLRPQQPGSDTCGPTARSGADPILVEHDHPTVAHPGQLIRGAQSGHAGAHNHGGSLRSAHDHPFEGNIASGKADPIADTPGAADALCGPGSPEAAPRG